MNRSHDSSSADPTVSWFGRSQSGFQSPSYDARHSQIDTSQNSGRHRKDLSWQQQKVRASTPRSGWPYRKWLTADVEEHPRGVTVPQTSPLLLQIPREPVHILT